MPKTVKRFIAGAVCPRCAEMDKIVMYRTDEGQFRECVACGYSDKQADEATSEELPTRVNKPASGPTTVEPVVFFRSSDKDDDN